MAEKIYIIFENKKWIENLCTELNNRNLAYDLWQINTNNILNLQKDPPQGIFYNVVSPSSHTRGNRFAIEMTKAVLYWLKLHNRKVINGLEALELEISKSAQILALKKNNINHPKTSISIGENSLIATINESRMPFMLKPNRGGSGTGVQIFYSTEAIYQQINTGNFNKSIDGITVIQDYIASNENILYRLEFINNKLLYAVKVNISDDLNNCPVTPAGTNTNTTNNTTTNTNTNTTNNTPTGKTKITHVEDEEEFILNFNKIQNDPTHESYQKLKIFFFSADWCGNCHVLKPPLEKLQDDNIEVYYFNIDNCPEMCEQFQISAIPLVVFIRGNNILETHMGGNLPKFTSILSKYIPSQPLSQSSSLPTVNEEDESISSSDSSDSSDNNDNKKNEISNCPLKADTNKFKIIKNFDHPIVKELEKLTQTCEIDVCGIEIVLDKDNNAFVIDMNCVNTNYNTAAEKAADLENYGISCLVDYLNQEATIKPEI